MRGGSEVTRPSEICSHVRTEIGQEHSAVMAFQFAPERSLPGTARPQEIRPSSVRRPCAYEMVDIGQRGVRFAPAAMVGVWRQAIAAAER